jgi:F-type H+-transporting ATPase subunit b
MACETCRKLAPALLLLALVVLPVSGALAAAPPHAAEAPAGEPAASPDHAPASGHDEDAAAGASAVSHDAVAGGHTGEEQHGESIWGFVGRLFNFAILAGTLVYFLRTPIAEYLRRRSGEIRGDLERAEAMRQSAASQIAEIEAKLKQLPAELDALKSRGTQEIAAEEARIRAEADAERDRLLEQTRREIDLQLRLARRELVTHAADLAVGVARERIQQRITDQDQLALVDRYLRQVKP